MRSLLALLCTAILAFALGACGDDELSGDVVPKSTPDLTVPAGSDSLAGTSTDQTSTDETSTDAQTTTGATTTDDQGTAGGTSGDTTAPSTTQTTPATPQGTGGTTTPQTQTQTTPGATGGTSPGEFNEFCQDNPGACPGN